MLDCLAAFSDCFFLRIHTNAMSSRMMIPPTAAPTPVPTFAPVENELLVFCVGDVDADSVAGAAVKLDADVDVVLDVGLDFDLVG